MSNYTTPAQAAKTVRDALKAKGYTSRQVSVRASSFSGGSSLDLTIKDPAVPFALVETIANGQQKIDRCEITGDILSGCNRYVSVRFSHDAEQAMADRYAEPVNAAIAELATESDSSLMPIAGTFFMVGKGRHGYGFDLWARGAGFVTAAYDARAVAMFVGIKGNA